MISLEEIKGRIDLDSFIDLIDNYTHSQAKIVDYKDESVFVEENYKTRLIPYSCLEKNYELESKVHSMYHQYKDCCYNLFPHEPLLPMCYVFEEEGKEHEVAFAVPMKWLIEKKDDLDGKRSWDEEKLLKWLNDEYTSEDSWSIWQEAISEDKVALFEINY